MKIFIDPGHGGKDPGAPYGDLYEKTLTLQIASELASELDDFGFDVKLSRSSDVFIELDERCKMANEWESDLFISIHINSAQNQAASGIETLVYNLQNENFEHLMVLIQHNLCHNLLAKNRGIKLRPDLRVLNGTKMPAFLIECGFITNEAERKKLNTLDYQYGIAHTISKTLFDFYVKGAVKNMDVYEAIDILNEEGIINTPGYWAKAIDCVNFLEELLINMAKRFKK